LALLGVDIASGKKPSTMQAIGLAMNAETGIPHVGTTTRHTAITVEHLQHHHSWHLGGEP
jgi:hypothetical protein